MKRIVVRDSHGIDHVKDTRNWHNTCFVEGTRILMADGLEKNIEDIKIGDEIMSVNMSNFEIEKDVVKYLPESSEYYIKIDMTLSDGTSISSSPHHPFYVKNKGWAVHDVKMAGNDLNFETKKIEIGDIVIVYIKGKLKEFTIESITNTNKVVRMYNIKYVEKNNTFFANGILVHNRFNKDE